MTATILFCTAGWLLGWWALGRLRRVADLPPAPTGVPAGALTIVIPARDEELSLRGLLEDLEADRPANARVVVVDDHSVDATAEIARSFDFVEVLSAPDLPPGWTGKCWACHVGSSDAQDGVLVFLDADVRLAHGVLARLVAEREQRGGLLSVQPWHDARRPYEKLSALFNVIAVMGTAAGSRRRSSGAFGPVLVTSVRDYRSVGGHAAVADEVVEDLALARNYRTVGIPVEVLAGSGGIRFRMYPAGFRQLIQGWTKNFASGAGSTRPVRLAAIVVWVTSLGSGGLAALDAVQGDLPVAVAVAIYGLFVAQLFVMFRQVGSFGLPTALLFPGLVVFFFAVFLRSAWLTHVRRTVRWRGRAVPVGATRG